MAQSLFRSIRMKLLDEGRTIKYLKYAIGEILLIIIGILIAVQISNWNEDRKAQAEFNEYVVQLKVDVKRAIEYMDYTETFMTTQLTNAEFVLKIMKPTELGPEDLEDFETALTSLGNYNEPQVYVGLLGQLMNGNMEIIKRNRVLAQQAMEMETIIEGRLANLDHIYNQIDHANHTLQIIRGKGNSGEGIPPRYSLETLRSSEEFINATYSVTSRIRTMIEFTGIIRESLESFLTVLEEYE